MNNLSMQMLKRLEKWRESQKLTGEKKKEAPSKTVGRQCKGNKGDVYSEEEWEQEHNKSQNRR